MLKSKIIDILLKRLPIGLLFTELHYYCMYFENRDVYIIKKTYISSDLKYLMHKDKYYEIYTNYYNLFNRVIFN